MMGGSNFLMNNNNNNTSTSTRTAAIGYIILSLIAILSFEANGLESRSTFNNNGAFRGVSSDQNSNKVVGLAKQINSNSNSNSNSNNSNDSNNRRELRHRVRKRNKKDDTSSSSSSESSSSSIPQNNSNEEEDHNSSKSSSKNNKNERDGECQGAYQQCQGLTYYGVKTCCPGYECEYINDYWWQCNPSYVETVHETPIWTVVEEEEEIKENLVSVPPQIIASTNQEEEEEEEDIIIIDTTPETEEEKEILENIQDIVDTQETEQIVEIEEQTEQIVEEEVQVEEVQEVQEEEVIFSTSVPSSSPSSSPVSSPTVSPTKEPTSEWVPPPIKIEEEEIRQEEEEEEESTDFNDFPSNTDNGQFVWWQNDDGTCQDVRLDWRQLSDKEKEFVVESFDELKDYKVTYDKLSRIHGHSTNFQYAHGNDFFLPWHRWYVLQLEEGVRSMKGKYACFRMPYWDWALDAGDERKSDILEYYGGLGRSGMRCVQTGPIKKWKAADGLCIRRVGDSRYRFSGRVEMMQLIRNNPRYKGSTGFRGLFESGAHSRPHLFLAGTMNTFQSPDDPLFWLHHSFVDKVYAMWQDCHDYDKVDAKNIPENAFPDNYLDFKMFGTYGIVPRDMHSIVTLGYTYQADQLSKFMYEKAGETCTWDLFVKPAENNRFYETNSLDHLRNYSRDMVVAEDGMYDKCMENQDSSDEASSNACIQALADFECQTLGESCIPPPEYLSKMNMQDEADILALGMCTRDCDADLRSSLGDLE